VGTDRIHMCRSSVLERSALEHAEKNEILAELAAGKLTVEEATRRLDELATRPGSRTKRPNKVVSTITPEQSRRLESLQAKIEELRSVQGAASEAQISWLREEAAACEPGWTPFAFEMPQCCCKMDVHFKQPYEMPIEFEESKPRLYAKCRCGRTKSIRLRPATCYIDLARVARIARGVHVWTKNANGSSYKRNAVCLQCGHILGVGAPWLLIGRFNYGCICDHLLPVSALCKHWEPPPKGWIQKIFG